MPILAVSKSKIVALTTHYGKRGWFFNAWISDNDWYKIKITANDCPLITKEFLDQERNEVEEWRLKQ